MLRVAVVVLSIVASASQKPFPQFRVIKEWNYINYTWPDDESRATSLERGDYIPQNNLIAGMNYYDGYYYLAVPRMKPGIPATLARINAANPRTAPLLEPFPSWEANELGNCDVLQNVQNVAIDAQGRMWIIDGGKTETLTKRPNITCSPKILIYDLKSERFTSNYSLPVEVVNGSLSFLYDIVVDGSDGGFAYITDNSRVDPGLIVYSLRQNDSWKIRDPASMVADPAAVIFRVNDEVIRTPINVAGIALGPKTNINEQNITLNEDREVFYCPISSYHLYSIRTSILKNKSMSYGQDVRKYVRDVGRKVSQTDGMKMDNKGVLYYGFLSSTAIARWDSSLPFNVAQIVLSKDDNYIQWPNSFAFDDDGNLLVLTNSLEKYVSGKISLTEPNFRILMAYVDGKSYVYSEETLVYSVYETATQNISANSSFVTTAPNATQSTEITMPEAEITTTKSNNSEMEGRREEPRIIDDDSERIGAPGVEIEDAPDSGRSISPSTFTVMCVFIFIFFHSTYTL